MNGSKPQPAEIISRPPQYTFEKQRVQPPSPLYVTINDTVVVSIWNSVVGLQVEVTSRLLLADGQIQQNVNILTPTSDRAVREFLLPLAEGVLLNIASASVTPVVRRGACFVSIGLTRELRTGAYRWAELISQYITAGLDVGWPAGVLHDQVEGAGLLRTIAGTNPAAGVEISETVPTNARWKLRGMQFALVTAVAVAARRVIIVVDDGATVVGAFIAVVDQTASQTITYTLCPGGVDQQLALANISIAASAEVLMFQGWRVRTSTQLLQAADDYGAPQLLVEEWIED